MILARLILGLLSMAPMTGYALEEQFDATIRHFWNADKAQIYRTLASLVRDGLAAVETVEQAGYPARQVHHITDAGRGELADWLTSAPQPDTERNAFLGRVFFASQLTDAEARTLLAARRALATRYLSELQQQLAGQGAAPVGDCRGISSSPRCATASAMSRPSSSGCRKSKESSNERPSRSLCRRPRAGQLSGNPPPSLLAGDPGEIRNAGKRHRHGGVPARRERRELDVGITGPRPARLPRPHSQLPRLRHALGRAVGFP